MEIIGVIIVIVLVYITIQNIGKGIDRRLGVDTEIAKKGFRDWTPSMRNEAVLKHLSPKETLQEAFDMTDQKQRNNGLFDVLGITDLRLIHV